MTLSELLDEHARHSRRWESSEACAQLKTQLEGQKSKLGGAITNVICLALGSPSNIHMDRRQDSHVQLAALETIRVALGISSTAPLPPVRLLTRSRSKIRAMYHARSGF